MEKFHIISNERKVRSASKLEQGIPECKISVAIELRIHV